MSSAEMRYTPSQERKMFIYKKGLSFLVLAISAVRHDMVVGIVSKDGYNCRKDGKPGFYTRLGACAEWITGEMNKARAN